MKLNFLENTGNLCQIYSTGLKYTLLDNELNPLHEPVLCKDYLTDVVWCETHNDYKNVKYGFKYKEHDYKLINNDILHIGIFDTEENIATMDIRTNLENFLNNVEDKIGFKRSECIVYDNGILINFSNEWIKAPYLLSLFTLFLRVGLKYDNTPVITFLENCAKVPNLVRTNDKGYVFNALAKIKMIIEERIMPEISFKSINSIHNAHDYSGIVSVNIDLFNKLKKVEEVV